MKNWEPSGSFELDSIPNLLESERKYYGFSWQHVLEKNSLYSGDMSFDRFASDESLLSTGVECVVVRKPLEKISKNNKKYYTVLVEDDNWNVETITFWEEDYNRFREELEYWNEEENRGNMLKMRLTRPSNGFKSYTFESPPRQKKHLIPKNKEDDLRLFVMKEV